MRQDPIKTAAADVACGLRYGAPDAEPMDRDFGDPDRDEAYQDAYRVLHTAIGQLSAAQGGRWMITQIAQGAEHTPALVRGLRALLGLSQAQFAQQLGKGMHKQSVFKWEAGDVRPSPDTLDAMRTLIDEELA